MNKRQTKKARQKTITREIAKMRVFMELSEEEQVAFLKKRRSDIKQIGFAPSGTGQTKSFIRPYAIDVETITIIQSLNQIKPRMEECNAVLRFDPFNASEEEMMGVMSGKGRSRFQMLHDAVSGMINNGVSCEEIVSRLNGVADREEIETVYESVKLEMNGE